MNDLNKILHVDDDEDILELTRMSLELIGGFEVHQCNNGESAMAEIDGFAPDLLLFDVMMPVIDGPELFARIRKMPGHEKTPVVFMTAKAETVFNEELIAKGAWACITKPFDPVTLPDQLREIWATNA